MTDAPPPAQREVSSGSPLPPAVTPQPGEVQEQAGAAPAVQRPSRWSSPLAVGVVLALVTAISTAFGAEINERSAPPPARVSCLDYYEKVVTLHEKGLEKTLRDLPRPEPECKSAGEVLDDLEPPQPPARG